MRSALDELPVLEALTAAEAAREEAEAAATLSMEIARLEVIQPSRLARLASWLRFGPWRRRRLRRLVEAGSG